MCLIVVPVYNKDYEIFVMAKSGFVNDRRVKLNECKAPDEEALDPICVTFG